MSHLEQPPFQITTSLGCTITIVPAPEYLGPGVLMIERVNDGPGLVRYTEVYLDPESMKKLSEVLA